MAHKLSALLQTTSQSAGAANQLQFPPTAVDNQWVLLLTSSIEQGNALHDSIHRGEGVNYSPTEAAAALSGSFSIQAGEELPASLSPLVPDELTLNHQLTTAAQRNDVLFAVFVSDTAKSVDLLFESATMGGSRQERHSYLCSLYVQRRTW